MKWWTLILLALLLTGLITLDRHFTERKSQQRTQSVRIVQLMTGNPFEEQPAAAIRLDVGEDEVIVYAYHDGIWHCVTTYDMPAESATIEAIIPALMNAQGVIRTRDPGDAASFGFDGPDALRLAICGSELFTHPTGDVIYALDVGRSIPVTGGSYVRPVNSDEIWAIDVDLRAMLQVDRDSDLPPMLDPHIVPQSWPGVTLGPARITIESRGREPVIITRRDRSPGEEGPQWEWHIEQGEASQMGDVLQVTSYAVFLMRAQYDGILAPRPLEQVGLNDPNGIITFETAEGPRLQLVIGGPGPRGGTVVFNNFTRVMYEVDTDIVQRMLPPAELLLSGEQGNPWQRWMRQ